MTTPRTFGSKCLMTSAAGSRRPLTAIANPYGQAGVIRDESLQPLVARFSMRLGREHAHIWIVRPQCLEEASCDAAALEPWQDSNTSNVDRTIGIKAEAHRAGVASFFLAAVGVEEFHCSATEGSRLRDHCLQARELCCRPRVHGMRISAPAHATGFQTRGDCLTALPERVSVYLTYLVLPTRR